eukprot:scaffold2642_cov120-Cylindrotheca_fusiformis.AAC.2
MSALNIYSRFASARKLECNGTNGLSSQSCFQTEREGEWTTELRSFPNTSLVDQDVLNYLSTDHD